MIQDRRVEPPTNWVEQLDDAIEEFDVSEEGTHPADLVAGWLAWYAQRLAEANVEHRVTTQRLERATWLAQQLTDIIVQELNVLATALDESESAEGARE